MTAVTVMDEVWISRPLGPSESRRNVTPYLVQDAMLATEA